MNTLFIESVSLIEHNMRLIENSNIILNEEETKVIFKQFGEEIEGLFNKTQLRIKESKEILKNCKKIEKKIRLMDASKQRNIIKKVNMYIKYLLNSVLSLLSTFGRIVYILLKISMIGSATALAIATPILLEIEYDYFISGLLGVITFTLTKFIFDTTEIKYFKKKLIEHRNKFVKKLPEITNPKLKERTEKIIKIIDGYLAKL